MTAANPRPRLFVALDTADLAHALELARALAGTVGGVKLGHEFFAAQGPAGVERIAALGLEVFLDLKFHDIPNTVAGAVRAALRLKPHMLDVHAQGGSAMMRAAAEAVREGGPARPLVLGVTVLTSLDAPGLAETGIAGDLGAHVVRLARLARGAGLDGVVCSAHEIAPVRQACGEGFALVVPGVRPAWAAAGDQKRTVTPAEAVRLGADVLVVGRPITAEADPAAAARRILAEMEAG